LCGFYDVGKRSHRAGMPTTGAGRRQGRAGRSSTVHNNAAPLSEYFNAKDRMKRDKRCRETSVLSRLHIRPLAFSKVDCACVQPDT
jgi:hypothetical protein